MKYCPYCCPCCCCKPEQGPRGRKGDTGPRGKQGAQGERKTPLLPGLSGERDLQGVQALRGEQGLPGLRGSSRERGLQGPQGNPGSAGISRSGGYGFAYSPLDSVQGGNVKFTVAGPMQEINLDSQGMHIFKSGVYQISYKVLVECRTNVNVPARFQIVINDTVKATSSMTDSSASAILNSSLLLSLLEGDLVKLVADIPDGCSFTHPSLQVIQIE